MLQLAQSAGIVTRITEPGHHCLLFMLALTPEIWVPFLV
jgi:hypothetical protein